MDRNFARALALVLKSEGGWSDNPADPGGATMKGVTLTNFRHYVQADATKADLRNITDAQLAVVYRKFYWDAIGGDALPDGVDYAVFDFGVNSGPGRAARYLQAVLGVPQDGSIGPATIAAAAAKPAGYIIDHLCDTRLAFLQRLPTWPTFGRGWSARVASVRMEALKMTAQTGQPAAPAPAQPIPVSQAPAARPAPPASPPPPAPKPPIRSRPWYGPLVAALFIGPAVALANWWHEINTWLHSFF